MTPNRLRPNDNVLVEIYFNGKKVDSYEGSGFHTLEDAVRTAAESSQAVNMNIEDYVFRVTDSTDHTSARYRINAHGNIKLIPEE